MSRLFPAILAPVLAAAPAHAATITLSDFSKSAYEAAVGAMTTSVSEDFESFSEGNVNNGWASSVGTFWSLGGIGSGGTVNDSVASGNFAGNDGTKLALRDGNVYGRESTTAELTGNTADAFFLDSNDTWGIGWQASIGGRLFDRIVLTLTDATDVGARMTISAGGTDYQFFGFGDGASKIVEIALGSAVSTATILFENLDINGRPVRNDGFSLDDIALSAVPLPAGAWFLLAGLGALAAMRRRKGSA